MEQFPLAATRRVPSKKGAARRLRLTGHLPGVVYGHGQEPITLAVPRRELEQAVHSHQGMNTLLALSVDGEQASEFAAMVKMLQLDPVTHEPITVDLQWVSLAEQITVTVPVTLTGEAHGVVLGGVLEQMLHEVEVSCAVTAIPDAIVADVSELEQGQGLHVSDLQPPPGVVVLTTPSASVCTIVSKAAVEGAAAAVTAAEPEAEGEAEAEAEAEEEE